jgi:hypothetical protein
MLVPEIYLKDLPTLDPSDFWDYCLRFKSKDLRREFNLDLVHNVPKSQIVEVARKHVEWIKAYVQYRENRPAKPYNLKRDRKGFVRWYDTSKSYCAVHPIELQINGRKGFLEAVEIMVDEFQHFVEQNAGYRLLWNDNGTSKSERAAQLLFLGIVKHYCKAHNIDISREPNIGRGPVDFKVSQGYALRALLELKLARNSKFWNNARQQLPTYLKAERVRDGFFIVVLFSDNDLAKRRRISRVVSDVNKEAKVNIVAVNVDATQEKPSASNL